MKKDTQSAEDKSKRVLYYSSSLASGGLERQLIYTALAAEKRGYKVRIVIDYPIRHYDFMLRGSAIEILCTHTTGYMPLKRFFSLWKIISDFRPHVLHAFAGMRNFWAMGLGKLFGVPVKIASIRSTYAAGFSGLRLYRLWADYIICNSALAAKIACEQHAASKEKVKVLYNAIDFHRFNEARSLPRLKYEIGLKDSVRLGVTLARFDKEKNLPGLIDALKLLNERGVLENTHHLLVGNMSNADLVKDVEDRIASACLSEKVTLLGFREDIPRILKTCDFLVLPSFSEGFPNVVMEAMAVGVFVIATPVGGTPELVQDGRNGLLTAGANPEDLAATITKYLSLRPEERENILFRAKEGIRLFDKEHAFEKIFQMYALSDNV